jgi:hypothetical protein
MPGMPVAWEGVQNQTSSRRAFQLDMFRSVKPAKSRRAGPPGLLLVRWF